MELSQSFIANAFCHFFGAEGFEVGAKMLIVISFDLTVFFGDGPRDKIEVIAFLL